MTRDFPVFTVYDRTDTCGHRHSTPERGVSCAENRARARRGVCQTLLIRHEDGRSETYGAYEAPVT